MPFASLGLMPELTRALADRNYLEPTPVQARVIPEILAGRDILAGAQTGTGKTAGFTLPLLQRLNALEQPSRSPRALILVPTRELASQVSESIKSYGKYLRLRTQVIFGGVSIRPQIEALRRGADIIVATPGRLLDHAQDRNIDLSKIEMLVLDEADRMLDMGFINDIRRVIRLLPPRRQNLLFSATYSNDMRSLAQGLLQNPVEVEVARRNAAIELVEQQLYKVAKDEKRALLSHLIKEGDWSQVLIFTRTKHGANRLAKQLEQDGIESDAIHGNKSQAARTKALADFKASRVRALVATEVASRGLDIKELPHVVNYELPNVPEDYVHRIGRTGRAGATGIAVSLVSSDEASLLRDIERVLGKRISLMPVPAFAAAPPERRPQQDQMQDRPRGEYRAGQNQRRDRGSQDRRPSSGGGYGRGGYSQDRGQQSAGSPDQGSFNQDRDQQPTAAPYQEGGYSQDRDQQSASAPRQGGYNQDRGQRSGGAPRQGGYNQDRGRSAGAPRQGGYNQDRGQQSAGGPRQGGYNQDRGRSQDRYQPTGTFRQDGAGQQDRGQSADQQGGFSQDSGQPASGYQHRSGPGQNQGGQDRRPSSGGPRGRGGPRGNAQSSGGRHAGGPATGQNRGQHSSGGRPGQPSRGGNSRRGRGPGPQAQRSGA